MSNGNSVNYFLKLLGIVSPNSAVVKDNEYSCVGSSYYYSSKPLISPLSAILKGKVLADVSISAKCKNNLGCSFDEDELLTKYLSRIGIVPEIVETENKIQKLFDDNIPEGKKISVEIAKKIVPDYKKEQEKIGNIVSSQATFEFEGGGDLQVGINYEATNIYSWKKENSGSVVAFLSACLNPRTVIPDDITEHSLAEFVCNIPPDDFDISVEGSGNINKSGDRFNILLKKI